MTHVSFLPVIMSKRLLGKVKEDPIKYIRVMSTKGKPRKALRGKNEGSQGWGITLSDLLETL